MYSVIGLLILVNVFADATPEVNHLIQTDHQGRTVHMDVIHDIEDKTVMAIIGDVSQYKNGMHTVNFHDYNKGYGVLKNINLRVCMLTKSPVPMATAEKYRIGSTNEVHDHFLKFRPGTLSYDDISAVAGSKIATFCKDYITIYADVTPIDHQKRDNVDPSGTEPNQLQQMWCVFSSCRSGIADIKAAAGLLG